MIFDDFSIKYDNFPIMKFMIFYDLPKSASRGFEPTRDFSGLLRRGWWEFLVRVRVALASSKSKKDKRQDTNDKRE